MERLTEYESIAGHAHAIPIVSDMDVIMMRLAAYEDTGLEPEEIDMDHEAAETLRQLCRGCDLDRLEELAEADKDERVVVPPCKVGDRLYEVTLFGLFIEWDLDEGFVWQSLSGINAEEIGKTVFLTREEAEKALEAMK